jgi:hypothetical protein
MTNSAGLVKTVASALMINEASLAVQMRFLREADIIPTGGRGTGGFAMRPRDAAALTIAAVVSGSLKDTADLTKEFLRLPMTYRNIFGPNRPQQVRDLRAGLDHSSNSSAVACRGVTKFTFPSETSGPGVHLKTSAKS